MKKDVLNIMADAEFRILKERPVSEDGLNVGVHMCIARRLAKLIRDESSDGCTIGLEAGWGCGKSSVITMMADELSKDDIFTYTFDSWEHEGETLRRGFLRGFINSVCNGLKVSPDENIKSLCKKLADLQYSTKPLVSKKCLALTVAGIFAPLVLGLSTIGALLIEKGLDKGSFTIALAAPICWELWIGTTLVLLPAVFALLAKVLKWDFLNLNTTSENSSESEFRYERSSLDFQDEFAEIVKLTIGLGYKKIVVVVDNLDRVQREDALRLWSTLKMFVSDKNSARIWIVIPYDPDGLSALWGDGVPPGSVDQPNADLMLHRKTSLMQSFLDKSIPLRLELPYVTVDSLSSYLDKLLKEAFPNDDQPKREVIRDVLVFTRQGLDDIPSPRQIKNYINQVGILRGLYESTVGLEAVCYYAVLRYYRTMSKSDLYAQIVQGKITGEEIRLVSWIPDLSNRMAAIHFGLDLEASRSATLIKPLSDALSSDDVKPLHALMSRYGDDFWAQINMVLSQELNNGWSHVVSNAFQKLYEISKEDGVKPSLLSLLQTNEQAALKAIHGLPAASVVSMFSVAQGDAQLADRLVGRFVGDFNNKLTSTDKNTGPTLTTYLDVAESGVVDEAKFVFDGSARIESLIELCCLSIREGRHIDRGLLSLSVEDAKKRAGMACRLVTEKHPKGCLPRLIDLLLGHDASMYVGMDKCIVPCLENGGALMPDYLRVAFRCSVMDGSNAYRQEVNSPRFWSNVAALKAEDDKCVAYLFALHQTRSRDVLLNSLRGVMSRMGVDIRALLIFFNQLEKGVQSAVISTLIAESIAIEKFEYVAWFVTNSIGRLTPAIALEVVNQGLIDRVSYVNPVAVVTAICRNVPADLRTKALNDISANVSLVKALLQDKNFSFTEDIVAILETLMTNDCPEDLIEVIKKRLGSFSASQWTKILEGKTKIFGLLNALHNICGKVETLGDQFVTGAESLLSNARTGESCYNESEQDVLRGVLTTSFRRMLDEAVIKRAIQREFSIPRDMHKLVIDAFSAEYRDNDGGLEFAAALKKAKDRNDAVAMELIRAASNALSGGTSKEV